MALWLRKKDERGNYHLFPYRDGMKVPVGSEVWDDTPPPPPPPSPVAEPTPKDHPVAETVQYPDTVREPPSNDEVTATDEASVVITRPTNYKVKGW